MATASQSLILRLHTAEGVSRPPGFDRDQPDARARRYCAA